MSKNCRVLSALIVVSTSLVGCGSEPAAKATNTVQPFQAAQGHEEKIKEALLKAGIKNPPAAIFEEGDDAWVVVIMPDGSGPNGEPPPGRPIPDRARVSKKDFSVTKFPSPNQGRPGGPGREVGN